MDALVQQLHAPQDSHLVDLILHRFPKSFLQQHQAQKSTDAQHPRENPEVYFRLVHQGKYFRGDKSPHSPQQARPS